MIKEDHIEQTLEHIYDEIRAFTDVGIIGVSRGADSTLMSCILVKALGAENVHTVSMPYNQTDYEKFNANPLAEALGTVHHVKDIQKSVLNIAQGIRSELSPLNAGNLRSRVRTTYLYTYNAIIGETLGKRARVIGTGNKSEDFIGYDTKGGDALADIFPIGQLFKSSVYQLLDYFVSIGMIDDSMIDRTPSAGLEDGQTDEGDLGYTYNAMEPVIKFCMTHYDELIISGMSATLPDIYTFVWNRHVANKHKHEAQYVVNIPVSYFTY